MNSKQWLLRIASLITLMAALGVFNAAAQALPPRQRVQSPEEQGVFCKTNDDCVAPIATGRQEQACLFSECKNGNCVDGVKTGLALGYTVDEGPSKCYEAQGVCSDQGIPIASNDRNTRVPRPDGTLCERLGGVKNPCQRNVCRNMVCTAEDNDGAWCEQPDRIPALCETQLCRAGKCLAVGDPTKTGRQNCKPSFTAACKTTYYVCSITGSCDEARRIADGAECAPDNTLGAPSILPAAFRKLYERASTPPQFFCDASTCRLQFCGDGVRNNGEACDGRDIPSSAHSGSRCTDACVLEWCGDDKVSGDEQCDGSVLAPGIERGARCNQATCRVEFSASISFTPLRMTYGQLLGDGQLNASVVDLAGTLLTDGVTSYSSSRITPYRHGTRPVAGTHPVTAAWAPSEKLSTKYGALSTTASLIVDPKKITCSVGSYRKKTNESNPRFEFTCADLVPGDSVASLGGAVALESGVDGSSPGTFKVVFTQKPTSPNYDITLKEGTLIVEGGPTAFDCSKARFDSPPDSNAQMKSEDFFICGMSDPNVCSTNISASEARKAELLRQGYQAATVGGWLRCNPWNGNPCRGAEPSRWALHEARVCYFSKCGDGKLSPEEACDGGKFKEGVAAGSTCDSATCTVIPPPNEVGCGDLSLTATATLNRQWGLFDVAISVGNSKQQDFKGYPGVAYIVIDGPQGFTSQFGANTGNTWYNPMNWSCANLKTDPQSGLLINPEGKLSTSAYGCFKFDPVGTQRLLDSRSAIRDDNNPEFLIANSSATAASFEGKVGPAIRLESVPAIASQGSWTATSNAKIFNPMRNPDMSTAFSARVVCKALDTCGDGIKGPSEQCDGSVPAGVVSGSTCNSKCIIEYCGDGIVNGNEECDGSARKQGAPDNAACEQKTCMLAKDCQYYTLKRPNNAPTNAWEDALRWYNMASTQRFAAFSGSGAMLSCIDKMVMDAEAKCAQRVGGGGPGDTACSMWKRGDGGWDTAKSSFVDDFFFGGLMGTFFKNFMTQEYVQVQLACGMVASSGVNLNDESLPTVRGCRDAARKVSVYEFSGNVIDRDCNVISKDVPSNQVCGDLIVDMMISPISLDWNSRGAARQRATTLVEFPIKPGQRDAYYLWHASEEFPLLAIDTNEDGAITDGTELFGEWTFGGKKIASLGLDALGGASSGSWRDGYEALDTLDVDHDHLLTGEELSKVLLFFDRDRDGVSDEGELVTAEQAGLVKLSTQSDYKDERSGDVVARRGFERVVNGQKVSGASVDWYAKAFANKMEAYRSIANDMFAKAGDVPAVTQEISDPHEAALGKPSDLDLNGVWRWSVSDSTTSGGLLFFSANKDLIHGASVAEVPLESAAPAVKNASSILSMRPFVAFPLKAKDGKPEILFEIMHGGRLSKSTAHLQPDGTLQGETAQTLSTGEVMKYAWTAQRVMQ